MRFLPARFFWLIFASSLALSLQLSGAGERQAAEADKAAGILVGFFEQAANIAQADKGNCSKLSTDLNHFAMANEPQIQKSRAVVDHLSETERKALTKKYESRLMAAGQKLHDGCAACVSDPQTRATLEKLML